MHATRNRAIAVIALAMLVFQTTGLTTADHEGLEGLEALLHEQGEEALE